MNELMLRRRNLLAKSEQGGGGGGDVTIYDTLKCATLNNTIDVSINMGTIYSNLKHIVYELSLSTNNIAFYIGIKDSTSTVYLARQTSQQFRIYLFNNGNRLISTGYSASAYTERMTFEAYNSGSTTIWNVKNGSGEIVNSGTSSYNMVSTNYNIVLFPITTYTTAYGRGLFHNLKLYDGDNIIHDIVPALKGELKGVYDKVTREFFYNEDMQEYYTLSND